MATISLLSPIRFLRRLYTDFLLTRKFYTREGFSSFKGVYKSFSEAEEQLPEKYNKGYNNNELAQEYKNDFLSQIESGPLSLRQYDYPFFYWLLNVLKQGDSICDFGGNIGIHFYIYAQHSNSLKNILWNVVEVDSIVEVGREIKMIRNIDQLNFYSKCSDIPFFNVWVASGSVQSLSEDGIAKEIEIIKKHKAKHILINRMPLTERENFVTLQNGGGVFYSQAVYNREKFISYFTNIGYELIDEWDDIVDSCYIPFNLSHRVERYSGLYFKLKLQNE